MGILFFLLIEKKRCPKTDNTVKSQSEYHKNTRAISFYQREGFEIQYSGLDEATGEKDYVMAWQQK